jgi:hypothetical protein
VAGPTQTIIFRLAMVGLVLAAIVVYAAVVSGT